MFIRLVLFIYLGRWVKWTECPTQRDNEKEAKNKKNQTKGSSVSFGKFMALSWRIVYDKPLNAQIWTLSAP